jgi:hypothetical protein
MESPTHNLPSLFKQLGLPDEPVDIDKFIATHSPLKPDLHLADAFSGRRAKRSFCVTRFWMTPIGRRWWIS